MAARSPADELLIELKVQILSHLSWRQQLGVRCVSRQWKAAVDVCLAHRQELHISVDDLLETDLNTERLQILLQSMPALRRLRVDGCFPECGLEEAGVETLLRLLPGLRSLDLPHNKAEGSCLSQLPAGLQSLSLYYASQINLDNFRHLTRCSQLQHLDLSGTRVRSEEMAAVVVACPQLERLAVAGCFRLTGGWLSELRRCPQLQDLDISDLVDENPDLSGVLTCCRRLERLRVARIHNPLLALPSTSLPGLTHLDLSETDTEDDTFRRLPDLLPGLRDLRLEKCKQLTCSGLASSLPRFTGLQVLDMRRTGQSSTEAMLSLLSGLPLTALAYDYCYGNRVSNVLRVCPTLTLLNPTGMDAGFAGWIAADLANDPRLAAREVTLIVDQHAVNMMASNLPQSYRLVEDKPGRWKTRVGWCGGSGRCIAPTTDSASI